MVRDVRIRRGLTQRRLALRAGTSQDAVSRIERGEEAPSWARFCELLLVMGVRAELSLDEDRRSDGVAAARALTPSERLRESCSWNLMATTVEIAGAEARAAGHPATRRHDT